MNADQMIAHAEKLSTDYGENGRLKTRSNRSGLYRHTFVVDGYAFKVASIEGENDCNVAEWDFYSMTTDKVRKWLAKPLYITKNGNVIVMEVLKVKEDERTDESEWDWSCKAGKGETKLRGIVEKAHNGLVLTDLHSGNWGEDPKGNLKCLDYGYIAYGAASKSGGQYDKMALAEWTCVSK